MRNVTLLVAAVVMIVGAGCKRVAKGDTPEPPLSEPGTKAATPAELCARFGLDANPPKDCPTVSLPRLVRFPKDYAGQTVKFIGELPMRTMRAGPRGFAPVMKCEFTEPGDFHTLGGDYAGDMRLAFFLAPDVAEDARRKADTGDAIRAAVYVTVRGTVQDDGSIYYAGWVRAFRAVGD